METDRAIEIVQSLADGVDPYSGERFPSGSPYQQADTVRALHLAHACRVEAFLGIRVESSHFTEGMMLDPNILTELTDPHSVLSSTMTAT